MHESQSLHWADYIILGFVLVVSLGIGLYHAFVGKKQKTTSAFIMANRKLPLIPTTMSLLVSFVSAVMFLGTVAEMYTRGIQAWIMGMISTVIAYILTERVFVGWLYPLKLTTVYKYLHLRFQSVELQIFGAILGLVGTSVYMGTCMYAPSLAMEAVSGFPLTVSVPIMAFVCTAYTALGGMKSVIWTDVFQFIIIMGSIVAVLVVSLVKVGGFQAAWEISGRDGRLEWYNLSVDPTTRHTVIGFLFGATFTVMCVNGLDQASVQRYSATRSLSKARASILLKLIPYLFLMCVLAIMGLALYAFYASQRCDPLASGKIQSSNQILAYFVLGSFKNAPGFSGLFLAMLYSGALSSVSSSLSASAAIAWEDILKHKLGKKISEYRAVLVNKCLVVFFGAISVSLAFMCAYIPGPVTQIALALKGVSTGPLYGVFLLGGIFRRANWIGAMIGMIFGIAFNWWLLFGSMSFKGYHPPLPPAPIDGCYSNLTMNTSTVPSFYTEVPSHHQHGENQSLHITLPPFEPAFNSGRQELSGIQKFYTISYQWYTLLGSLITIVVGLISSLLISHAGYPQDQHTVADEYLITYKTLFDFSCSFDDNKDTEVILDEAIVLDEATIKLKKDNCKCCESHDCHCYESRIADMVINGDTRL